MGMTQGWLALALMAAGAAAPTEAPRPEINYTFQMVEARGLDWRDPAAGVKPVAQHSAVSVWTAPADFVETLAERSSGVVATQARLSGPALTPAHLTTRKNQAFVTKVSYRGEGKQPKRVVENVREGMVATIVGRKLDQGVLAQLVIEDTDIRAVHAVDAPSPARAAKVAQAKSESAGRYQVSVTASMEPRIGFEPDIRIDEDCDFDENRAGWLPSKAAAIIARAGGEVCRAKKSAAAPKRDDKAAQTASAPTAADQIQIPEIGRAQAAGEWLIPEDGVLVIGFGPHTVADASGLAIVRERLAVISAEVADETEATVEEATADEADDDSEVLADSPAPRAIDDPFAPKFKPILPVPPRTATAIPALPSRNLPQGVHADGRPAQLPPLPEDAEAELPAPADEKGKPRPSPQSRRKPVPPPKPVVPPTPKPSASAADKNAEARPEADEPAEAPEKAETPAPAAKRKIIDPDAGRASLVIPAALSAISSISAKPAQTLRAPLQGAQILLPLKPLTIKLPLSQKLEFELLGRIVADDEAEFDARMVAGN